MTLRNRRPWEGGELGVGLEDWPQGCLAVTVMARRGEVGACGIQRCVNSRRADGTVFRSDLWL